MGKVSQRTILLLSLFGIVPICAADAAQPPTKAGVETLKTLIEEARSSENVGMYASAAAKWADVIERFPRSECVSQAILGVGRCLFAVKDYRRAAATFDSVARLNSASNEERYDAWHWMGMSQRRLAIASGGTGRHYAAAARSFKRAIDLNPNGQHARHDHFFYALCLNDQGQDAEARRALRHITERWDCGDCVPEAWLWLGRLSMAKGDYEGARASFQHVIQRWPKLEHARLAHREAAYCDALAQRYAQAADHLLAATAGAELEEECELLYDAARCLELDGQNHEAVSLYKRVLERCADSGCAAGAKEGLRRLTPAPAAETHK